MTRWLEIHPTNPQKRLLQQTVDCIRNGEVIVYPTDSCYALGGRVGDRGVAERLRQIRRFDRHHLFTLVCRDLSEIAVYARVDNRQFRMMKGATPGPYTFILTATRELPRRILHDRRKTIGLRVPDHPVAQALLAQLDEPLVSCTLTWPGASQPVGDPSEWRQQLEGVVDIALCGGPCGVVPTTVVDLTGDVPNVMRQGKGSLTRIGLPVGN